ncbi:MAG: pyruvate, phosphate dikinase [Candidatus Riflebacteria bacterium]|nr:pyruvate, phosphate dikinase [Candidatus Riflebacteria bacterium]
MKKYVYAFGGSDTEGTHKDAALLGKKGANLAEMCLMDGIPVPAGFTISTDCCEYYYANERSLPSELTEQVATALKKVEKCMGQQFGYPENPLLISCRASSPAPMPGMIDTILNLGINDDVVRGMIKKTGNERFGWDIYRRFVQQYGDIVLKMIPDRREDEDPFEVIIHEMKKDRGVKGDSDLTAADLQQLVVQFKKLIRDRTGLDFPDDPWKQLIGAIGAVFESWMDKRTVTYRKLNDISQASGIAVVFQAMVFGNIGDDCATGVCFTRNPSTGENKFYGEYLLNAQGEDVVAGIRTPYQVTRSSAQHWAAACSIDEATRANKFPSLEESMPAIYAQLIDICKRLEMHFMDMLDIEFTIQKGRIWMLQCRIGKRTTRASLRIAVELLSQKLIDKNTAISRVDQAEIAKLPDILDPNSSNDFKPILTGLASNSGCISGIAVFTPEDAVPLAKQGKACILICKDISTRGDMDPLNTVVGIIAGRGGMTCHAAIYARGQGKCYMTGATDLVIDGTSRTASVAGTDVILKEGDMITLDGNCGKVYPGSCPLVCAPEKKILQELLNSPETA